MISLNLKGLKKQMGLSNYSFKQTVYDCTIRKNTLHSITKHILRPNTKPPQQIHTYIYNDNNDALQLMTVVTKNSCVTTEFAKFCESRFPIDIRLRKAYFYPTSLKIVSIFCKCANTKYTSKPYSISNQQRRSGELWTCEIV